MSRSGYSDAYCDDQWAHICWRGAVASSIRGKRGQAFLRELIETLDAMPVKQLAKNVLAQPIPYVGGAVCALGSVGVKRGLQMEDVDVYDYTTLAGMFGIAEPLVREIEFLNDEACWGRDDPEARWRRMRLWAAENLRTGEGTQP